MSDILLAAVEQEGAAVSRRPPLAVLGAVIRNPIEALPPEVFTHPLVYSGLFGRTRVYLSDPALIHEALVRNADALSKGQEVRRALGPALGNGLLTSEGSEWRWQRQSVAPAFHPARLLEFLPAMMAAAQHTAERWRGLRPHAVVDIGHEMMGTTFAIIVDTMLSGPGTIDAARVERAITDYLRPTGWVAAIGILKAPEWTPYPGRGRRARATRVLRETVRRMVAERRRTGGGPTDLVTRLLGATDPETGRSMSDEEITDNILTFITAGHETTAQGLGWTLHLLARHPEIEAKVLAELRDLTGEGDVRPDQIAHLTYTRQVFAEAMRLYPPAPMIVRRAETEFRLGRYTVPAGAMVLVPVYAVHRHALLWPDPERFDPDRFAPDQVKARHRYSYLPFGAGPRVCIGSGFATMEAVAILAVLLKAFRLRNTSEATAVPAMRITLRPLRPIRMSVEPRPALGRPG